MLENISEYLEKNKFLVLAIIILFSLFFRVTLSQLAPLGSGPDESGHFNYIRYFEANWTTPILEPPSVRGTVWYTIMQQPPLYHGMNALIFGLVKNSPVADAVHLLRSINAIFAVMSILLTHLIVREMTNNKFIIYGATLVVAFLPTHVVVSAVLNNGPLMWFFVLTSFYFMILSIKHNFPTRFVIFAGIFFGAAVVAKFTATTMGIAYLFFAYLFLKNSKLSLFKKLLILAIPFLTFSPLYLKNLILYKSLLAYIPATNLGYTGLSGFELLKTYILQIFAGIWLQEYGTATIPDYRIIYFLFLGVMALISAVGLILVARKNMRAVNIQSMLTDYSIPALLILFVFFDFAIFAYMLTFWYFPDSRFVFQSIAFSMIFFVVGLNEFCRRIGMDYLFKILILLIIVSLIIMDFTLIFNYNAKLPFVPWPVLKEFL